jgi:hypothetical protein
MADAPGRSSIDDILDVYKRDIDVTLIEGNLRLTVDERMRELQRLLEFAEALTRAPRAPMNA